MNLQSLQIEAFILLHGGGGEGDLVPAEAGLHEAHHAAPEPPPPPAQRHPEQPVVTPELLDVLRDSDGK